MHNFLNGLTLLRRLAAAALLFGFLVLGTSGPASATTIQYPGIPKPGPVSDGWNSNFSTITGEISGQFGGRTPSGYDSSFFAYCLDLTNQLQDTQTIALRSTDVLTVPALYTDSNAGKKAAWLYNQYATGVRSNGSAADAAALQVAIWAALYNTDQNLSGGRFVLSSGGTIATKATALLAALYSVPGGNQGTATWLDTGAGQDLIIGVGVPVPEAGTLVLLGIGLLGVVRVRARQLAARRAADVPPLV